jgi:tetratricopeptide (TPR) repeat protein
VALFRKKSTDSAPADEASGEQAFTPQPEKARKWFEHAKTAALSSNYEYALSCFANGIKFDPELMSAHESMYKAAIQYAGQGGKSASGRETKSIDDGTVVGRFAAAEFAWMKDINNGGLALKALDAAVKAGLTEVGNWLAKPTLTLQVRVKKPQKSQLIAARDLFAKVGAWNEAIAAGEFAYRLDPSDNELAAEMKDLAAQRAMDHSGASSVEERNLLRAKRDYEEDPNTPDKVNKYAQLVKKQGTPEATEQAYEIYMEGFRTIGEYRFRMAAGDIRIEDLRHRVKAIAEQIKSNGQSADLVASLNEARDALFALQREEYGERVTRYPTDRTMKYDLGIVEFELGNFDAAMECFQKAKDEPKLRVRAGHMLGRSFARKSWHNDAILEYEEALAAIDATESERELVVRYDLMLSLLAHAREERSVDLAKQARDICSVIARKDISFRDIRDRRSEVDGLVKELSTTESELS